MNGPRLTGKTDRVFRVQHEIEHDLLDFMGVATDRVTFSWVSASEGNKWQELVNETTHRVKALGPFHEFQDMTQKGGECQ